MQIKTDQKQQILEQLQQRLLEDSPQVEITQQSNNVQEGQNSSPSNEDNYDKFQSSTSVEHHTPQNNNNQNQLQKLACDTAIELIEMLQEMRNEIYGEEEEEEEIDEHDEQIGRKYQNAQEDEQYFQYQKPAKNNTVQQQLKDSQSTDIRQLIENQIQIEKLKQLKQINKLKSPESSTSSEKQQLKVSKNDLKHIVEQIINEKSQYSLLLTKDQTTQNEFQQPIQNETINNNTTQHTKKPKKMKNNSPKTQNQTVVKDSLKTKMQQKLEQHQKVQKQAQKALQEDQSRQSPSILKSSKEENKSVFKQCTNPIDDYVLTHQQLNIISSILSELPDPKTLGKTSGVVQSDAQQNSKIVNLVEEKTQTDETHPEVVQENLYLTANHLENSAILQSSAKQTQQLQSFNNNQQQQIENQQQQDIQPQILNQSQNKQQNKIIFVKAKQPEKQKQQPQKQVSKPLIQNKQELKQDNNIIKEKYHESVFQLKQQLNALQKDKISMQQELQQYKQATRDERNNQTQMHQQYKQLKLKEQQNDQQIEQIKVQYNEKLQEVQHKNINLNKKLMKELSLMQQSTGLVPVQYLDQVENQQKKMQNPAQLNEAQTKKRLNSPEKSKLKVVLPPNANKMEYSQINNIDQQQIELSEIQNQEQINYEAEILKIKNAKQYEQKEQHKLDDQQKEYSAVSEPLLNKQRKQPHEQLVVKYHSSNVKASHVDKTFDENVPIQHVTAKQKLNQLISTLTFNNQNQNTTINDLLKSNSRIVNEIFIKTENDIKLLKLSEQDAQQLRQQAQQKINEVIQLVCQNVVDQLVNSNDQIKDPSEKQQLSLQLNQSLNMLFNTNEIQYNQDKAIEMEKQDVSEEQTIFKNTALEKQQNNTTFSNNILQNHDPNSQQNDQSNNILLNSNQKLIEIPDLSHNNQQLSKDQSIIIPQIQFSKSSKSEINNEEISISSNYRPIKQLGEYQNIFFPVTEMNQQLNTAQMKLQNSILEQSKQISCLLDQQMQFTEDTSKQLQLQQLLFLSQQQTEITTLSLQCRFFIVLFVLYGIQFVKQYQKQLLKFIDTLNQLTSQNKNETLEEYLFYLEIIDNLCNLLNNDINDQQLLPRSKLSKVLDQTTSIFSKQTNLINKPFILVLYKAYQEIIQCQYNDQQIFNQLNSSLLMYMNNIQQFYKQLEQSNELLSYQLCVISVSVLFAVQIQQQTGQLNNNQLINITAQIVNDIQQLNLVPEFAKKFE